MTASEMRNACRPSAPVQQSADIQEVLKTVAQALDTMREQAETATAEMRQTQERAVTALEARTTAVETACTRMEQAFSVRIREAQTATTALQEIETRLQWKRRTLMWTMLTGFMAGLAFLILSLSLPGVNRLMYKLIMLLGN